MTENFAVAAANLIYGIKRFVPPTYCQYKIKRKAIFGKKYLKKVSDGIVYPVYDPNIDLCVCDDGCLLGTEEALKMYKAETHL